MAHVVAIDTRYVGEAALAASDREVLRLTVKFMNTYLRAALNARTCAPPTTCSTSTASWPSRCCRRRRSANDWALATLVEIAGHFKYYARLAHGIGLGFVTETAAYDLCALCEMASARARRLPTIGCWRSSWRSTSRDRPRSVRCAACARRRPSWRRSTCASGETARAQTIYEDMANESPERLRSIRDEMLAITSKDFWEVVDRGTNFDYVSDARKEKLRQFFAEVRRAGRPPAAE